ncbi:MAG TPA: hypothetical protein VMR25_17305 [Planctomycetaceae bacterium]|jgi:hypothetical protein|nr:hypothetical protein [Planctomycetaceae bacterium]
MNDPEYDAGEQQGYKWMGEIIKQCGRIRASEYLAVNREELSGDKGFKKRFDEGIIQGANGTLRAFDAG